MDGGATESDFLYQLQADLLLPVVQAREITALRAAYLAGLGTGLWRDPAEVRDLWRLDRAFRPAMPADRRGPSSAAQWIIDRAVD